MEKLAVLEYLSSGLNRAGCADLVTSPAWTCRESTMSANTESLREKKSQTLLRVYSRFPLASSVYMRCILGESLWIRYSCSGWLVVWRFKNGLPALKLFSWGPELFLASQPPQPTTYAHSMGQIYAVH